MYRGGGLLFVAIGLKIKKSLSVNELTLRHQLHLKISGGDIINNEYKLSVLIISKLYDRFMTKY
jgi:hypothetical protein